MLRNTLILALSLLLNIYAFSQVEVLGIHWPEEYQWKVAEQAEDETQEIMILVPGNESMENWTIQGTMISMKGTRMDNLDVFYDLVVEQIKAEAIKPKVTIVEKNYSVKNPYILFKLEAKSFKSDPNPESTLFYLIQGDTSLFLTVVSIHEPKLSKDFLKTWKTIFLSSSFQMM